MKSADNTQDVEEMSPDDEPYTIRRKHATHVERERRECKSDEWREKQSLHEFSSTHTKEDSAISCAMSVPYDETVPSMPQDIPEECSGEQA